jgi:5-(carboxyamino)imidazole ribonucleotide synthase
MGVEMFLLSDGDLLVNEIAPRPHNSGHFTLDACETSQFHQHLLAIAGWPLGPTELIKPTLMLNLIGEQQDKLLKNMKRLPFGAKLHLYGKKEIRPGRKMGHLNLSMENQSQLLETLKQLQVWDGEFLDRMLT